MSKIQNSKNYTIRDIQEGLRKKEFSAEEIFKHYQEKIKKENKKLNAYLSTLDYRPSTIDHSKPLAGVPAAIKDNILIDGIVCTAGSKILKNYISAYDATVIKKLKSASVQFLGKTNMDEFAMGTSTENSAFGPTKNPCDTSRVPGGSSGGSAAAVAADLCVFALGSDTGGSIRQPAAFCGVVGLKPTYGRVSRHGLIAMASSLDQIGPITKNVYDGALVMNTIADYDNFDSTIVKRGVPDYTKNIDKDIKGLKVGVPREFFGKGLSLEVAEKVNYTMSKLESLGCKIVDISLPNFEYALATYYIIVPSEVSANLSRFDGIRYGHSSKSANTLTDTYFESRAEGFGPEPKRRIMIGAYALSSGYYDAYYLKAQKVRRLIKNDFDSAFGPSTNRVDIIVGPVSPTTAFKIGEKLSDPLALYLEDIYTVPVNLAGLPGISIPCGLGKESGLPVGFQMIGKPFDEETLLRTAYQLEKELGIRN
ncbi:MAG: aspartyl/glutamyl-tRNA amidotransferase subunit A [Candidatus Yanofskybacteria bacterium RIFCSPHIGHO2_02_FULL_41_11]|uniref:Glutamyl-tRNA(Gln) amidotransferase subunit A n=1 Tax=Candidatus Yanofskybacteria bacterium RIFCSPHIGHO2_02_FULL_41_11 TaxID=1802675 RepID=A0A1F8FC75_9BACT|nr:MAG: aspartyl/glutamyl-tRNA amidotransferase subunit A [Candidatus Yanofskybacteria bacterium RIFCSPHIGHO2_02_FULL_41_11]